MILLERYCESICEEDTVVLKHAKKTLSHAVVFLMVMLVSPAISKAAADRVKGEALQVNQKSPHGGDGRAEN